MSKKEINPSQFEGLEGINLDRYTVINSIASIRRTNFDNFRQQEFLNLDSSNPEIGAFIQREFETLIHESGEKVAYQGLTGMLAAYHLLTECSKDRLPIRFPYQIKQAPKISHQKIAFLDNGSIINKDGPIKPSIIETLELLGNNYSRRGASIILFMFEDIIN